nr:hypothetical protein [Tanacetum cinerariifolium]
MEQYRTHIDYAVWEVIMNGDALASIASVSSGAEATIPPKITKQKIARRNELKAKSTLLFKGNKESKKKQKTILKQQYKNFAASRFEGLDKTYDRFQKLISQLEIHDKVILLGDANLKLLRSLPPAWNTHTLIIQNKSDLDTLSMDDLYNNLKVYKVEIRGQSSSSLNSQNVAFLSSDNTSSTKEVVNTAHNVSTASSQEQVSASTYTDDIMFSFFANQSNSLQLDNEDLEQIDTDDLKEMDLKWLVAMLTMRVKRFIKKTGRNLNFNGKETVGFDKTKVELETPANALVITNGMGYDWSYQAEEGPIDFALIAFSSSGSSNSDTEVNTCSKECLKSYQTLQKQYDQQREILNKANLEIIAYQLGLESLESRIVVHQKNETVFEEDIVFLKYDVKIGLGKDSQLNEKDLNNKSDVFESASDSSVNSEEDNNQANDRYKAGKGYHAVPPPYIGNFIPSRPDQSFAGLADSVFKSAISETITSVHETKTSTSKTSKESMENPKTVRPSAPIIKDWESDSDRPIGNVIDHISKDSGSYMLKRFNYVDLQEIDGGFVAFGGSPKGGKILGKGKIRIGKLDFEDVYFVKELKFNLFSVSQMCDKKNSVKTECLVLSPDFKLPNENQVLLKVPRQNNMNNFDLKTVVSLGDLLLPTTFWAEAVSIACYVQNRVLVTKPHNKTPYELSIGRSPKLDFMKPFGCPVTILNTLDHLGKFEGKADEWFLVEYSVNSKAFKVFNSRTMKVEENLHIKFLETKPNVAGRGPEWLFDIDSLTNSMNYEPVTAGNQTNNDASIEINANAGKARQEKASDHEYILLPFMPSSIQSLDDKDAGEVPDKGDECVSKRSGIDDQEKTDSSTQDVDTAEPSINTASTNINTGSLNINIVGSNDPSMPSLEETGIFDDVYDDREVGAEADTNNLELSTVVSPIPTTRVHKDHLKEQIIEADTNNLELSTVVSPIPTTRVHKDHLKEQIIGDLNLTTQKRRMLNFFEENAMDRSNQDILAYASFMGFIMYQLDVKSAFQYDTIEEEV